MPRNGSGVYSLPGGSVITNGDTSDASDINTPLADLVTDANAARPIVAGGTGATSAADALTNLGLTATAAELNILDGVTATAAELNLLDGVTATTAELNYVDGVTSNIQTQLDAQAAAVNAITTSSAFGGFGVDEGDTISVPLNTLLVEDIVVPAGTWRVSMEMTSYFFGGVDPPSNPPSTRLFATLELYEANTSTVISKVALHGKPAGHRPATYGDQQELSCNAVYTFASDTTVDLYIRCYTIDSASPDNFVVTVEDTVFLRTTLT